MPAPTRSNPHPGLVRSALAVLIASVCVAGAIIGAGHLVKWLVFGDQPLYVGAGGYADYGVGALHRMTLAGALEWAGHYLIPTFGVLAAVLLIRGRSPRWLRRAFGASP